MSSDKSSQISQSHASEAIHYKILMESLINNLKHDVNNFLQELLLSIESLASSAENEDTGVEAKNNFNGHISASVHSIFAIRDLITGYTGIFDLPLARHIELASSIYAKNIHMTGDPSSLKTDTKQLLTVYLYILLKLIPGNNLNVVIDGNGVSLGPIRNPANFLPTPSTTSGELLKLVAQAAKITATEDQLIIEP